jgi:hypothetical protein
MVERKRAIRDIVRRKVPKAKIFLLTIFGYGRMHRELTES